MNPFIGDGICHDEANDIEHNFDHGDCCRTDVPKDHCSDCLCSENGIITTPGFPKIFGITMELNWLIQLSFGQYIHMDFEQLNPERSGNPVCSFG